MGLAVERIDAAGAEQALAGLELMGQSRVEDSPRAGGVVS
jgi:hypothetical protein